MRSQQYAEDRWLPIFQHGAPYDCRFRGYALAEEGLGFIGDWSVNDQNDFLARLFGIQKVNKA
jgi:hypothetical protein